MSKNKPGVTALGDVAKTMSAIEGLVRILGPLETDERQRVLQGALVVLGERPVGSGVERPDNSGELAEGGLSPRARMWMRQNGLSSAELEQVFHIENGQAEIIVSDIPGKDKREKTRNAYVLTGVANLLSQGAPTFMDEAARALCVSAGCFDRGNHAKAIKDKGNLFSGSKESGWAVTAPGLKHAANLIRGLSQQSGRDT
jgi:hypothetical protein